MTDQRRCTPVHPHACGEIAATDTEEHIVFGTSPRLWGDCNDQNIVVQSVRYIPTLVGRFPIFRTFMVSPPVHPHACGEIFAM